MRTLSVVTKLTVEARWSGVSAARGLPQSSIPPDAAAPRLGMRPEKLRAQSNAEARRLGVTAPAP